LTIIVVNNWVAFDVFLLVSFSLTAWLFYHRMPKPYTQLQKLLVRATFLCWLASISKHSIIIFKLFSSTLYYLAFFHHHHNIESIFWIVWVSCVIRAFSRKTSNSPLDHVLLPSTSKSWKLHVRSKYLLIKNSIHNIQSCIEWYL